MRRRRRTSLHIYRKMCAARQLWRPLHRRTVLLDVGSIITRRFTTFHVSVQKDLQTFWDHLWSVTGMFRNNLNASICAYFPFTPIHVSLNFEKYKVCGCAETIFKNWTSQGPYTCSRMTMQEDWNERWRHWTNTNVSAVFVQFKTYNF